MDSTPSGDVARGSLGEIARVFLRLGLTAFGGPAAHIAMMEDELVRRRRWLPREEFLDLLGATHLIPGPNSTELAIHLGHRRAGWPGLLVAGACFIVPAMLLTLAAAWAYVRFGSLPQADALLYGVKPVILAVVLQALWGLGKMALTTAPRVVVAVGSAVASALGANELLILAVAGGALAAWSHVRSSPASSSPLLLTPFALHGVTAATATAATPFSLGGLFLFFLKVGSVLFGSGYVLLAFLRADLVERWGWLTEAQLLDAVAVGQLTPGPVFTTATFIGYLVGGVPGAGLATLGIFLPAFVFVALSGPLVPRIRRSRTAGAVLDGVNAASLALMSVVTWQLGRAALVDGWTVALAVVGSVLLLRWRVNSAWLVLGGAAVGLLRAW
ncbi:chromate efflux transporter [Corallococcus sp. EGB]|uniref:chromate efflux transporter n=1 Tax=Corallococcus sp. EGB TaxID=1521117 RepID=UPI001CBEFB6F|nr:chromate efflux transporter [Corallococcus sp. EGB]